MSVDIAKPAELLRETAHAEILPRFRRLDAGQVRQKTEAIDLVTEADEEAERVITAAINRMWPEALVVGEEAVSADPALLERSVNADLVIFLDPVDGTSNFVAGVPLFAVMAGVVVKGETVAGIIYDPMGDDWVLAEKGSGAYLRRADGSSVRQHFAQAVPLGDMAGTASPFYLPREQRAGVLANLAKVRVSSSFRCAGHEYRMAAGGHLHYCFFNKLMPWDHVPGTLICTEAGANVARLDGRAYRAEHSGGGLLLASDAQSWETLRREVFTV
ncbi:inositol monophosphatase family protein [uncultured Devosia sp.]|uniref:inositol monophosphatase family protein n=1 Tax=uncultured Devosia sp. TaxID=211434 RepID=UPI0035CA55FE